MNLLRAMTGAALVVVLTNYAWAGGGSCCNGCDCEDCGPVVCPNCYCELKHEVEKEKKYCWNIECKAICIPKVKFPWEDCCAPPKCAKMKYVNVLKKKEYECEVCKYKWEAVCDKCECHGKPAAKAAPSDASVPPAAPPVTIHGASDYYGAGRSNFVDPPTPVGLEMRDINFHKPSRK